jgi:hypothetical protein
MVYNICRLYKLNMEGLKQTEQTWPEFSTLDVLVFHFLLRLG